MCTPRANVDMSEPYWGGTLDASCEDKEGAFAALQGFVGVIRIDERTNLPDLGLRTPAMWC